MFYLKEVRPKFKLYVCPINIDPANPALPISTPESYAKELARKFGPFFTKGLPADTSALDNGILDEEEFLEQDDMVLRGEPGHVRVRARAVRLRTAVLLFLEHRPAPAHVLAPDRPPAPGLRREARGEVRRTSSRTSTSRWTASWTGRWTAIGQGHDHHRHVRPRLQPLPAGLQPQHLAQGERLSPARRRPPKQEDTSFFENTDWSRSRAYGIGLNGLYINQRAARDEGIVAAGAEADNLVREIARKLEEVVDPATGEKALHKAYIAKDVYQGPYVDQAPDIVLGFNRGYRISWQSPLGGFPKEILEDNTQKWSGDHMSAAEVIPGILLANRKIAADSPALYDLTATILGVFGIEMPRRA